MAERTLICPICNKPFKTDKPRAKYCVFCKDIANQRNRANWEKKTDYGTKQRNAMREKRRKEREARLNISREEYEERQSALSLERRKHIERLHNEYIAEVKAGEPLACRKYAEELGDKLAYWYWYKVYDIRFNEQFGHTSGRVVNGISVYEPDFEKKVVLSIDQDGKQIENAFGVPVIKIESETVIPMLEGWKELVKNIK